VNSDSYATVVDTWAETSSQILDTVMTANRAAFTAWGFSDPTANRSPVTAAPADRPEPPEWSVSVGVDSREDIEVGTTVEFSKTISESDVEAFAAASGDTNPLHLDDSFAEQTRFGGTIAHGTLVGGLISAALARLPGLTIYLSQELEFQNPVRPGDRVTAVVEIIEVLDNDTYRLHTVVTDAGETIIDGEAVVLIDELPE
jgi:acyl dehydratase